MILRSVLERADGLLVSLEDDRVEDYGGGLFGLIAYTPSSMTGIGLVIILISWFASISSNNTIFIKENLNKVIVRVEKLGKMLMEYHSYPGHFKDD